ncbi:Ig-like domain-containing protein [Parasaccharibacter apium]|uniref:Ig-like domain-containing protein n=1 Tax=Parasaccharibacter apium TaxID=1510841 RepID=UPI0011AED8F1|nr:Ig-like domain-containing protein [Parasaccharibacter apium]
MQQSSFLVRAGVVGATLLALGGCVGQQSRGPSGIEIPPNPFANEKRAAHCEVSPVQTDATGRMSVSMTVSAGDGGTCPFSISKGGGGSYVSFGVVPPPENGRAFLYNYDNRTYVEYTPAADYKGTDGFTVELIPAHAQPRRQLQVRVQVEPAVVAAAPAPSEEPGKKMAESTEKKTPQAVHHATSRTVHHAVSRHAPAAKTK